MKLIGETIETIVMIGVTVVHNTGNIYIADQYKTVLKYLTIQLSMCSSLGIIEEEGRCI